jgi:glutamate-5-semialdehyde dehydrogenase
MSIQNKVEEICQRTKQAYPAISSARSAQKDSVLESLSRLIAENSDNILAANREDIRNASENGVPLTMIDRLTLNESRINGLCDALNELIKLKDPCGSGECFERPKGIKIKHVRVPIGVIGIIYEARPNVTVDAAALCIKTGNACILKGGKEAIHTNICLTAIIKEALKENGLPEDACNLIDVTDREATNVFVKMRSYIDLMIPRGGKGLIQFVKENASMPIIETGAGNCHIYIDDSADLNDSVRVAVNAKCQRPSVCNAIENMLVHESVADEFLPLFKSATNEYSLEIRGCEKTQRIIPCTPATDEDFYTEYNDYIISVKIVSDVDEAIEHINMHSTNHSEAIMTKSIDNAEKFVSRVDSAAVYVNASTRFTDGGEFGLGAEIGISTQKLHARGPMGLSALTSEKYIITGNGTIR